MPTSSLAKGTRQLLPSYTTLPKFLPLTSIAPCFTPFAIHQIEWSPGLRGALSARIVFTQSTLNTICYPYVEAVIRSALQYIDNEHTITPQFLCWCRGWDLNPQVPCGTADFKSEPVSPLPAIIRRHRYETARVAAATRRYLPVFAACWAVRLAVNHWSRDTTQPSDAGLTTRGGVTSVGPTCSTSTETTTASACE